MHFTEDELHRWRQHGPGTDRQRVAEHLQQCGTCASRYAAMIRTRPLASGDEAADAAEFGEAGYAAGMPRRPALLRAVRTRRWLVPLAAAAVLVAAIAVPRLMRSGTDDGAPRFRGAGLHLVAPEGTIDRQATFVWSSGLDADRFRVEFGQGDRILYREETSATRLPMPAALWHMLRPDVQYWWSVTALDRGGEGLATSPRRTFSVERQ